MKQCNDIPLAPRAISCIKPDHTKIVLRIIPLETVFSYYACSEGHIWKGGLKIYGHKNFNKRTGKTYRRYHIKMKDGKYRNFYGHRLVAMAWLGPIDGKVVRHLSDDSEHNSPHALTIGTYEENNTVDRIIAGNYMNRGKKQEEEECPF